mgnify:CR=1 FL=1
MGSFMSKSTALEEYVAKNPYRFIGWYTDETTQAYFQMLEGVTNEWMGMLTNRQSVEPSDVSDINRWLGGKQALEALKFRVDEIFTRLTTRPDPEDEEDGEYEE